MKLKEYIKLKHAGNQSALARHVGVSRQEISRWVKRGDIVVDDVLYSKRRCFNVAWDYLDGGSV